jgi:paraquat-inducible protein A
MGAVHLMACHECDRLHRIAAVPPGATARCRRCGAVLLRSRLNGVERALALAVAGVILFVLSNLFPFLSFKLQGIVQETLLLSGIRQLYDQGLAGLALLVLFTTIIAPGLQLLFLIYILLPLSRNRVAPGTFRVFRYYRQLQPWGMTEVFMLGILVSIVKLAKMAQVVPGISVYSFMALIFVIAAAMSSLDPHAVWERWKPRGRPAVPAPGAGRASCPVCHLLSPLPPAGGPAPRCPRCGAALHRRKPDSLARTWALVTAAFIFYIPANVLPITVVTSLGAVQSDTIMSGVIYFVQSGSWPIALVIFVASVFVPLLKLLILTFLLVSVGRGAAWRPKDRTRLYRLIEAIGRWSMVDIFVVTILVALVSLGALANIQAGPAAAYFALVVIITIFAAMSFDPRLIWDRRAVHAASSASRMRRSSSSDGAPGVGRAGGSESLKAAP